MLVDRGRQFTGYFITKADRPTKLFGIYWENAFPCGTYVNQQGVTRGVSFFIFHDDDLDLMESTKDGRHCEQLDLNISETDALITDVVIGDLIKQVPLTAAKKAKLYDNQLQIVESDFVNGFASNRKMVGRRLIQLMPEFLGRTFNKALSNKPSIWQPVDEVPNIWKCNLGPDVNS